MAHNGTHYIALGLGLGIPILCLLILLIVIVCRRTVLNWLDLKLLYRGKWRDGIGFLRGNFAPVTSEKIHESLSVVGEIPEDLNGVFLRNGPNPRYTPLGGYHWFDGDGMVHAIRIKDKKVSYANNWIHTSRFNQEEGYGRPVFMKIGELTGFRGLFSLLSEQIKRMTGILDLSKGSGQANTNLVYHRDCVLALHEVDMPYILKVLCNGVVETVRRVTHKDKQFKHFTAHPKICTETGDMHFFSYNLYKEPYLKYGVYDSNGKMTRFIPIKVPSGPVMMHDFAITKKYVIFLYMPLFFKPMEMMSAHGFPFVFDTEAPSRFGLLPRDAKDDSEMQWFELPPSMIFHTCNAWDDDSGKVHLYACSTTDYTLELVASQSSKFPLSQRLPGLPAQDSNSNLHSRTREGGAGVKRSKSGMYMPGAHGGMSIMGKGGPYQDKESTITNPAGFAIPSTKFTQHEFPPSMSSMREGADLNHDDVHPTDLHGFVGMSRRNHAAAVRSKTEGECFLKGEDQVDQAGSGGSGSGGGGGGGGAEVVSFSASTRLELTSSSPRTQLSASGIHNSWNDAFTLVHFTFDTNNGLARSRKLIEPELYNSYLLEFPTINETYLTKRNRYIYLATFCDGMKTNGVLKADIGQGGPDIVAGRIFFGDHHFGGECAFVPRRDPVSEDDGYLLTFIWNAQDKCSSFVVYDARTMAQEALARVDLKCRVPFGFHALFLTEEEFQRQMKEGEDDDIYQLG